MFNQDLKYRGISWVFFPLFLCGITAFFIHAGLGKAEWGFSVLINLSFLALNGLFSILWFALKGINPKAILKEYIGIGDLLFFVILGLGVPFFLFIPFQLISLFLATGLGLSVFKKTSVPLAGLQALLAGICIGVHQLGIIDLMNLRAFVL